MAYGFVVFSIPKPLYPLLKGPHDWHPPMPSAELGKGILPSKPLIIWAGRSFGHVGMGLPEIDKGLMLNALCLCSIVRDTLYSGF